MLTKVLLKHVKQLEKSWLNIFTTYSKSFGKKRLSHKTRRTLLFCQSSKKDQKVNAPIIKQLVSSLLLERYSQLLHKFVFLVYMELIQEELKLFSARDGDAGAKFSFFAKSLKDALEMEGVFLCTCWFCCFFWLDLSRIPLGCNVDPLYSKNISYCKKALYTYSRTWVRVYGGYNLMFYNQNWC